MNDFTMTPFDSEHAVFHAEIEILIDTNDFTEIVENIEGILDHYNRGVK